MRLPRDVSGRDLARALGALGYEVMRQTGSHIRLTSRSELQHHVTIPDHAALRVGTLAAVVSVPDDFDRMGEAEIEALFGSGA